MKAEMKWIIHNYNLKWPRKTADSSFISPLFHADNDSEVKWRLRFSPGHSSNNWNLGNLSFFLQLEASPPGNPSISARFSIALYDEKKGTRLCEKHSDPYIFNYVNRRQNGVYKIGNQEIIPECQVFSIRCALEYESSETTATTIVTNSSLSSSNSNEKESSSLAEDLKLFFSNQMGADISFIVEGKEFRAHKTILSARSPVFAAMLSSEMRETYLNRVDIEDVTPDIFEALLRFIYTDQVDLTKSDAKELLVAANRYLLLLLKYRCEEFLSDGVTIENCCEMLGLSDLHNAANLKKTAADLFRIRKTEITKTEGWKRLKESRPDLAFDILEFY